MQAVAALGIIPARGGSKRVPGKNARLLEDKPLLAYTIESALDADSLARVVVSTDDASIRKLALSLGAEAPFLRPAEIAEDQTPDFPVLQHALRHYRNEGITFDYIAHLRPTTPFRRAKTIDAAFEKLTQGHFAVVRTVTKAEGVHHPYWSYKGGADGKISAFVDGIRISDYYQRQLLPPAYRINGVVDVMRADVLENGSLFDHPNMGCLELSDFESMDIDTEFDFAICSAMMRYGMKPSISET